MPVYSRKKKAGLKYWYKFDYNGKTYYTKAIFDTRVDAKRAESEEYRKVSRKGYNPANERIITTLEAINTRLDELKIKKSNQYYKDSKRYCGIFLKAFGAHSDFFNIRRSNISDLLLDTSQELQERGKDNYTVNAMLRCYKAMYNSVIKKYELEYSNPCIGVDLYAVEQTVKYIPTDEEIKLVLAICNEKQKLLINFVAESGCRISEALRVRGKDIFDDYVILYTRKSKGSNLVPRKVPVSNISKIGKEEKLFSEWSKNPKFLEKKIRKLGIPKWGFHNLRHRRASIWSKQNIPLFQIMLWLGHSQISTTQKYLQLL